MEFATKAELWNILGWMHLRRQNLGEHSSRSFVEQLTIRIVMPIIRQVLSNTPWSCPYMESATFQYLGYLALMKPKVVRKVYQIHQNQDDIKLIKLEFCGIMLTSQSTWLRSLRGKEYRRIERNNCGRDQWRSHAATWRRSYDDCSTIATFAEGSDAKGETYYIKQWVNDLNESLMHWSVFDQRYIGIRWTCPNERLIVVPNGLSWLCEELGLRNERMSAWLEGFACQCDRRRIRRRSPVPIDAKSLISYPRVWVLGWILCCVRVVAVCVAMADEDPADDAEDRLPLNALPSGRFLHDDDEPFPDDDDDSPPASPPKHKERVRLRIRTLEARSPFSCRWDPAPLLPFPLPAFFDVRGVRESVSLAFLVLLARWGSEVYGRNGEEGLWHADWGSILQLFRRCDFEECQVHSYWLKISILLMR